MCCVTRQATGTSARIRAAMNGEQTRRVRLVRPIRVIILYGTVLAKEDGEVLFFDDLYGQDRRLERLLALAPVAKNRQLQQLTGSRATGAPRISHTHRAE